MKMETPFCIEVKTFFFINTSVLPIFSSKKAYAPFVLDTIKAGQQECYLKSFGMNVNIQMD